ncbi:FKBP-type peptidyl-prolyl cis-trans isomerase [soil metagenome]
MLRRSRALRRPAALLIPLVLVSALTAACGEEATIASGALQRTDAFEINGDVGSSPEVTWKGRMEADEAETEVVTDGDGAELEDGDQAIVNYYVGNGFTQQQALDTYAADQAPIVLPVGEELPQPSSADPSDAEIARYLLDAFVADQVGAGDTVGTRKVATVTSADITGVAGSVYDVGNEDALMIVIDIDSIVRSRPDGSPIKARPTWVPAITAKDSAPAALDFTGVDDPDGTLKTAVLYQGTGDDVAKNDLIVVNYLGQVYDADKAFDKSYGRGPFTTVLSQGAVIKGWDQALIGVAVGSRVMLEIPPKLGYGKDGQGDDIPGNSTLYFVIDVLAAG